MDSSRRSSKWSDRNRFDHKLEGGLFLFKFSNLLSNFVGLSCCLSSSFSPLPSCRTYSSFKHCSRSESKLSRQHSRQQKKRARRFELDLHTKIKFSNFCQQRNFFFASKLQNKVKNSAFFAVKRFTF